MFAYDFPILGLFWTILWFFLWIAWLMLLFKVIFDIFRSKDLGGGGKALWALFVVIIPWLGVLVYLIVRGRTMTERDIEAAQAQEQAFRRYVAQTAGGKTSAAEELAKLAQLRDSGVLSDAEFAAQKAKLLR
ncbi:MAG: SHOCT domain-containing protein [Ilumatobacteraceae bacterium]